MNKKYLGILAFLAVLALGLQIQTAEAATESVYVEVYFNIAAVDELTVTLLGQSAVTSAAEPGTAAPARIDFNCSNSNGSCDWVPAHVAGTDQDAANPVLQLDNTGTTNLDIVIYAGTDVTSSCITGFNYNDTDDNTATSGTAVPAGTGHTIEAAFTPAASAINLRLWANFTDCNDGDDDSTLFWINATTA